MTQIPSKLNVRQSNEGYQSAKADLSVPDPSPEKAKAFLKSLSEVGDGAPNEEDEEDAALEGGYDQNEDEDDSEQEDVIV